MDPRLEDPRAINEAIAEVPGRLAPDGETLWVIDDRREAIAHAIGMAREGDVVLLAGKGHEPSIVYGTDTLPGTTASLRARRWQRRDRGADHG